MVVAHGRRALLARRGKPLGSRVRCVTTSPPAAASDERHSCATQSGERGKTLATRSAHQGAAAVVSHEMTKVSTYRWPHDLGEKRADENRSDHPHRFDLSPRPNWNPDCVGSAAHQRRAAALDTGVSLGLSTGGGSAVVVARSALAHGPVHAPGLGSGRVHGVVAREAYRGGAVRPAHAVGVPPMIPKHDELCCASVNLRGSVHLGAATVPAWHLRHESELYE